MTPSTAARCLTVALVLLGVTACSQSTPERPATPLATGEPEPYVAGPLEEYLGWVGAETAQEVVADQTWRENRTAACMAEQGFDYWPVIPAVGDVVEGTGPAYGSPEFVAEYGYGAWNTPDGDYQFMFEGDASANNEYRAAMSEAEGAAYDEAFLGPVVGEDASTGTATRSGGCIEAADNPSGDAAGRLTAIRDEALAYLDAIAADPRFGEVDADWASCMADEGYTFANPAAAEESVWAEYLAAAGDGAAPPDDAAAAGAEGELRLAAADHACRAATDWHARHRAIEIELQQEYVDAHRADLDALAEALAAPAAD